MAGFNIETTQITHIPIIELFYQIGLDTVLSLDGTKDAIVSMSLSSHMVSKWGAAMAKPFLVRPLRQRLVLCPPPRTCWYPCWYPP
jgi:hypothetical protein